MLSLLNRIIARDEADEDDVVVAAAGAYADGDADAWRRVDRSLRIEDAAARMASAACACSLLTCRDVDVDDVATSLIRNGERGVDEDMPAGEDSLYLGGDCGTAIFSFSVRDVSALAAICVDCVIFAYAFSCCSSLSSSEEVSLALADTGPMPNVVVGTFECDRRMIAHSSSPSSELCATSSIFSFSGPFPMASTPS